MDRPELIATDLDGTLLHGDATVSPRTSTVIGRAVAAGVPVVIVTGRPPRWLAGIGEALGGRLMAVCANGALVYDLASRQVVAEHLLAPERLTELVGRFREQIPGVAFAIEFGWELHHEPAYVPGGDAALPGIVEGTLDGFLTRPAVKLLVQHRGTGPDELLELSRLAVGDLATLTHSSHSGVVEVSAPGVTKAAGLAEVAAGYGVRSSKVIAFGDMPNDLPMLAWAGYAVAMKNAHREVLDAADEITASNDEDGVAAVLERWF